MPTSTVEDTSRKPCARYGGGAYAALLENGSVVTWGHSAARFQAAAPRKPNILSLGNIPYLSDIRILHMIKGIYPNSRISGFLRICLRASGLRFRILVGYRQCPVQYLQWCYYRKLPAPRRVSHCHSELWTPDRTLTFERLIFGCSITSPDARGSQTVLLMSIKKPIGCFAYAL